MQSNKTFGPKLLAVLILQQRKVEDLLAYSVKLQPASTKKCFDKLLYWPLGRRSSLDQAYKLTVLHLPYTNQKMSTVSHQIALNSLQTLICLGRDTAAEK